MNTLLCLLLFCTIFHCLGGQTYRIPDPILHTVGTTNVYDKTQTISTQGTLSFLVTETLQGIEDVSGNRVEEWRVVETTNTVPSTSNVTTSYRDKDGTFFQILELATVSIDGVSIHKNFSRDLGIFFNVGDMVGDQTSFYNVTIGDGVDALIGYGQTEVISYLEAVKSVSTPWGQYNSAIVADTISSNIFLVDIDTGDEFLLTQDGNRSFTYTEGFGIIYDSFSLTQKFYSGNQLLESQQYSETMSLKSSTYFPQITNVVTTTIQEEIEAPSSGWVYQGEYPWMYSDKTQSWYYQLIDNYQTMWYDAKRSRWIRIDNDGSAYLLK